VGGSVERGARVTLVTWNMDHWQGTDDRRAAGWDYLDGRFAERVDWDIALLQECVPPASRERVLFEPVRNGPWGTAVVTRAADLRGVAVEVSHPGCLVVGEVVLGERGPLTVVALYGVHESSRFVGGELYDMRYVITTVHRLLSDLNPLIDRHGRHRTKQPLVVGGDLNLSTQIDPPDRDRHRNALERFVTLGLTDAWLVSPDSVPADDCRCGEGPACRHVRTHTHRRSPRPWQLDYVFANPTLRVRSCRTIIDGHTWERSDHAPVVAVLERL
jgi:endonuclease/exonuclease/phosphatase family metal-dependent hydrolase